VSSIVVAASQSLVGTGRHLAVIMAQNDADHAVIATADREYLVRRVCSRRGVPRNPAGTRL
jgi:uncharacterized phage protein gp47/JayE